MKLSDKMGLVITAVAIGVQLASLYLAARAGASMLAVILMGILSSLALVSLVGVYWLAKGGKFRQQ